MWYQSVTVTSLLFHSVKSSGVRTVQIVNDKWNNINPVQLSTPISFTQKGCTSTRIVLLTPFYTQINKKNLTIERMWMRVIPLQCGPSSQPSVQSGSPLHSLLMWMQSSVPPHWYSLGGQCDTVLCGPEKNKYKYGQLKRVK